MRSINFFLAVLLSISSVAHGEAFLSKDWAWSTDTDKDGYYFAATINGVGSLVGQYCYFDSGNCLWLIGLKTTCDEGSEYPALVNSDAGALQVTLLCAHKYEGRNVLAVSDFDGFDRIVRNATKMGIVLPLQNDEFKVSRFGLAGSTYALDLMRAATERRMKRKPTNVNKPDEERI